jgi:hypothetical protein
VITRFEKKHYPWSNLTNKINIPTPQLNNALSGFI